MPIFHLVARLSARDVALVEEGHRWASLHPRTDPSAAPESELQRTELVRSLGQRLWCTLRQAFPVCYAAVLMPDHLHLLIEGSGPAMAHRLLCRVLCCAARGLGRATWQRVPWPEPVLDLHHLRRQVRYVALNPCRSQPRLASDPLQWRYSTHRDLVGATVNPWVTAASLAAMLGQREEGFVRSWHRYVSSDPCVDPAGTALPVPEPARVLPQRSLAEIGRAVARSFRCSEDAIRQRGPARATFLALARHQGVTDTRLLAEACGCSEDSVWRAWTRPVDQPALAAACLTLGDPRLQG